MSARGEGIIENKASQAAVRDALEVAGAIVWSRSFAGNMGRLIGAVSIIALVHHAFRFGLSAVASDLLGYYSRALRVAFGWLDPYMQMFANYVLAFLKVEVQLAEYWHHIFILLWVLFVRDAGVAFLDRRPLTGAFRLLVGLLVAAAAAVLASANFSGVHAHFQNILIATVPTIGIFVYDVALYLYSSMFQINYLNRANGTPDRSRTDFLRAALARGGRRFGLGLAVTALCLAVPAVWRQPVPLGGMLALGAATVANAAYWIWRGAMYAFAERSAHQVRWVDAFKKSEAGRFGMAVTGVFAWIAVFVVLNAGAQRLGL